MPMRDCFALRAGAPRMSADGSEAEIMLYGEIIADYGKWWKDNFPDDKSAADFDKAVKEAKAGKVDFRMDKTGNCCVIAGKLSFEEDKLVQNVKAVIDAVQAAKPAAVKGQFIKSLTLCSTMGPGVACILATEAE